MTLGAAQMWLSAPWEGGSDDSTSHAGSDRDWIFPPSSFNPMTWPCLAQELDERNFPGSLVVKTLHLHCTDSISGQRIETPHAVWPGQRKKEKKDNIL